MSLAWSEWARGQLERPVLQRHIVFAIFSLLVALPLSFLWSAVSFLRQRSRVKAQRHCAVGEPLVMSIGNVTLGGTGKSPIVRAFARRALSCGFDVAILSRGFGQTHGQQVIVRLDEQDGPLSHELWTGLLADECLEHAVVLGTETMRGQVCWIAQGADRRLLLDALRQRREADQQHRAPPLKPLFVFLDDGLSQTRLPVHFDVIVWDPRSLLQAPRACLPFGPYRAGWPGSFWSRSLPVADIVVWSRCSKPSAWFEFYKEIERAQQVLWPSDVGGQAKPSELVAVERKRFARVTARDGGVGFALVEVQPPALPQALSVLTGVARPQRILDSLTDLLSEGNSAQRTRVVGALHLSDHGALTSEAVEFVEKSQALVISLKDLCRWWREGCFVEKVKNASLFVLCLEIELKTLTGDEPHANITQLMSTSEIARPCL